MAEDETQPEGLPEGNEGRTQTEGRTITLGEASALVAVLAAGVYVLGLVALWVPLARTYTGDYSTAWYAVSLIPRTTVIGQGVVLLGVPLLVTLPVTLLTLVFNPVGVIGTVALQVAQKEWLPLLGYLLSQLFLLGLVGGLYLVAVATGLTDVWLGLQLGFGFWEWVLMGLPGILAPLLAALTMHLRGVQLTRLRALWIIAVWGIVLVFFVAFILAATRGAPPLPVVHVASSTSIDGDLLAHVDDFWYVFDEEGTLVAIPDREVNEVRITEGE